MSTATRPISLEAQCVNAVYENGILCPLEEIALREHQRVRIYVLPPEIHIPPSIAARKVSRFVLDNVSYLMHGGDPTLVISDRAYWRVPVVLTFPTHGADCAVGAIDVNAVTGELQISPALIEEITRNADELGRLPSEAARSLC
jgi:predicted DNA-binding antitoxin AbrB/MazE fold protein